MGIDVTKNAGYDAQGRWPHAAFRCLGEDRWLAVSCGTAGQRTGLIEALRALGIDCENAAAQGIANGTASVQDAHAWLSEVFSQREPEVLERMLQTNGVPAQKVMRGRDVDGDAILNSRGFLTWLWREDLGSYPVYSGFWLVNGERPAITQEPARFGEHNEYVLGTILGKSKQEIEELLEKGVVGYEPLEGAELGVRPGAMAS